MRGGKLGGMVDWARAGGFALALAVGVSHASGATTCAETQLREAAFQPTGEGAPAGGLTVVSINLGKETNEARIAAEIHGEPAIAGADVFSLQEVIREDGEPSVAERLAKLLGMSVVVAGTGDGSADNDRDGVALLSRFPLGAPEAIPLPRNDLGLRSRCRVALAATLRKPGQAVRVVGLHLDTRVNAESRLRQLEPVVRAAAAFQGPVVLAGDFNTNGFLWVEHLLPIPLVSDQARAVVEHLEGVGFSTPFALDGQATNDFLGLQLDWVFVRGMEAAASGVEPLGFSDHHAVWVRFEAGSE